MKDEQIFLVKNTVNTFLELEKNTRIKRKRRQKKLEQKSFKGEIMNEGKRIVWERDWI